MIVKYCDGKQKHISETAVKAAIEHHNNIGIQDYYLCKKCKKYHIFTIEGKRNMLSKRNSKHSKQNNEPRKMKEFRRENNHNKKRK